MKAPKRLKPVALLGVAPLAAVGIWGGAAFASGAGGGSSLSLDRPALVGQQATNDSRVDDYVARLAANLGIDEQTLRDALKTTSLQEIDQAQADGAITQAEADRMRAAVNAGKGPLFGLPGGHHGRGGPGFFAGDDLAAFLGVDEATLRADLQGGKTLAQEAADHGKSRDELKAFLTQQFAAGVDEDVQEGHLTADEAAKKKADFASGLDALVDGQGGPVGRHDGTRGMHRGG
ncbi:MAG: hypothetical protein IT429_17440 [Gemmataceae bacterium]|nr:hypothetical protein [Gemmataceae bacterium]